MSFSNAWPEGIWSKLWWTVWVTQSSHRIPLVIVGPPNLGALLGAATQSGRDFAARLPNLGAICRVPTQPGPDISRGYPTCGNLRNAAAQIGYAHQNFAQIGEARGYPIWGEFERSYPIWYAFCRGATQSGRTFGRCYPMCEIFRFGDTQSGKNPNLYRVVATLHSPCY